MFSYSRRDTSKAFAVTLLKYEVGQDGRIIRISRTLSSYSSGQARHPSPVIQGETPRKLLLLTLLDRVRSRIETIFIPRVHKAVFLARTWFYSANSSLRILTRKNCFKFSLNAYPKSLTSGKLSILNRETHPAAWCVDDRGDGCIKMAKVVGLVALLDPTVLYSYTYNALRGKARKNRIIVGQTFLPSCLPAVP